MKLNLFLGLLILSLMNSCGQSSATSNSQTTTTASQQPVSSPSGNYQRIGIAPDPTRSLEATDFTVELANGPQGTYYLMGVYTDQFFIADSTVMNGGKINFKRDEGLPAGVYFMYFPDQRQSMQILLDQDQKFTLKTDANDIVNSMQVKGSIDNELLYKSLQFDSGQRSELQAINDGFKSLTVGTPEHGEVINKHTALMKAKEAYFRKLFAEAPESMFTAFKEAGQNPTIPYSFNSDGSLSQDYLLGLREQYWDNVNLADKRLLRTPVISNKLEKHFTTHMPQNPDSIIRYSKKLVDAALPYNDYFQYFANWITLKFEPTKTSLMDAEAVYVHMIQNYFTKERAFWQDSVASHGLQLRAHEMAQSLVGRQGPDVIAKGPDGKDYSIYEMKADYIAVFMWNPECEHCQEQSPKLVQYYNENKDKGFDVFGIVLDTEEDQWKNAIAKYGMTWTNVNDPTNRAIYAKYFVDNTPELYVLNPERKIIGKNLKVFQIDQIIEQDKANR